MEDLSAGSAAVVVDAPGPVWWNPPVVTRLDPEEAEKRRRTPPKHEPTDLVSAGARGRGGGGVATAQVQAGDLMGGSDLLPDRFTRVVGMLDSLRASGGVTSYSELMPPADRAAEGAA